jgi:high-affinity K+ transport system ATPase subunit B
MDSECPRDEIKVLCFPPVKKGRRRHSKSMDAAGDLTLLLLERDGELIPGNVVRLKYPNWPETRVPEITPALFLALMVYEQLSQRRRQSILRMTRFLAFEGDRAAAKVQNLLRLSSETRRSARRKR